MGLFFNVGVRLSLFVAITCGPPIAFIKPMLFVGSLQGRSRLDVVGYASIGVLLNDFAVTLFKKMAGGMACFFEVALVVLFGAVEGGCGNDEGRDGGF